MSDEVYHIPALLTETIDGLQIKSEGTYVDVTFGGGGHSRAIMLNLGENGHLYGFDQDQDAIANKIEDSRFTFVHSNFCYLSNFLRYYGVDKVDGIIADLGVSFHHFDDSSRGFSFRFDGALDMRMNQKGSRDASWIIANYSEEKLADVFYLYGELRNSRRLAAAIVKARGEKAIESTEDLLSVVRPLMKPMQEKKELAQVFQALRIEVNKEIDVLQKLLIQSLKVLKPGGRIAVLTYHSLEDRLVKNFFKSGNIEGKVDKDFYGRIETPFRLVNNKVIAPSDEEIGINPRSRSAKLRIAERI
ncbi:MAG: 16S rRNA (cytosine(1402)-N(4))-methyltransferase RsmH [Muribaculaceae bacterium]